MFSHLYCEDEQKSYGLIRGSKQQILFLDELTLIVHVHYLYHHLTLTFI